MMIDVRRIKNSVLMNYNTAAIIVVFYVVCYTTPYLFIMFLKKNAKSDEPIEDFHKLNALFFVSVITFMIVVIVAIFVPFVIVAMLTLHKLSVKERLAVATTQFLSVIWGEGKYVNAWVAIVIALITGFSIFSLYFVMSPKELQSKFIFPLKVPKDDENDENVYEEQNDKEIDDDDDDDEWVQKKLYYRYLLAYVMSIAVFALALISLYGKTNVYYECAILYILGLSTIFISLEWPFMVWLPIVVLSIPSFMGGI